MAGGAGACSGAARRTASATAPLSMEDGQEVSPLPYAWQPPAAPAREQ
jgi:hypothetical protein